ncbi:cobalamin-binding protein [Aquisalimonas lutea]|uniref:cobalamin-binding protein n=1 Tax=Aquisalimonas lutea TaxID=1327750 RepID=UPI0025B4D271|nr:cobalamin-binding protein [Aquisalimonas lutea]MDN3517811.1 cobalamin-binding protein [Aquisalimonas lutea]
MTTRTGYHRIVCLTEETTETLYRLGREDRIVGISGFTVRPPQARRDKPKVSAFTSAKIDRILALEPDLVLGFSDMQADIAAALIRAGVEVHVFNQRTVAGILAMIRRLGRMVDAAEAADALAGELEAHLARVRAAGEALPHHPRVYFQEWDDPQICGIGWVSELIAVAGGIDCFADCAGAADARSRIIADADEVAARAPEVIIGSWCGKKFRPEWLRAIDAWADVPAIRNNALFEIKSSLILQPGPAALTDGVDALHAILRTIQPPTQPPP